jgi:hypothetical protein
MTSLGGAVPPDGWAGYARTDVGDFRHGCVLHEGVVDADVADPQPVVGRPHDTHERGFQQSQTQ